MEIHSNDFILLIGKKYRGKSHMAKYILYRLWIEKKVDYGIIICPTQGQDHHYNIVPKKFIHCSKDIDKRIIENLIDLQRESKKRAFLVLDDVMGILNLRNKFLMQLATMGRKFRITVILAVQDFSHGINTIKKNAERVFLFNADDRLTRDGYYNQFLHGVFNNRKEFEDFMNNDLIGYKAIYYDGKDVTKNIRDRVKIVTAPKKIPRFFFKFKSKNPNK